jgi:hypothetical protein
MNLEMASAMLAAIIVAFCAAAALAAALISRRRESSMSGTNSPFPESVPVPAASPTSVVSVEAGEKTSILPVIKEETGISRFEDRKSQTNVGSREAGKTKKIARRRKKGQVKSEIS